MNNVCVCVHVRLILCDTIRGHIYYIMRARQEPSANVHARSHTREHTHTHTDTDTHARTQTFAGYVLEQARGPAGALTTRHASGSSSTCARVRAALSPLLYLSLVLARVLVSLPCRRRSCRRRRRRHRPDGGLRASENRCNGFARAQRGEHTQFECVCACVVSWHNRMLNAVVVVAAAAAAAATAVAAAAAAADVSVCIFRSASACLSIGVLYSDSMLVR